MQFRALPIAFEIPTRTLQRDVRRHVAPRRRVFDVPRENARQQIRRARARPSHISSANSRKSATRPARSRDWLKSSSLPRTRTSRQNCSRSSGIFCERFAQSFFVARHSAFLPEKKAELSVKRIERTGSIDFQELLDPGANIFLCFLETPENPATAVFPFDRRDNSAAC